MPEDGQLEMRRPDLAAIPRLSLPRGYGLRTYRVGDEMAWADIMNAAPIGEGWTAARCRASLISRPEFWPDGLFFATWRGRPVGSACAWRERLDEARVGTVHMVGVLPDHAGRGLGRLLTARVLAFLAGQGFEVAHLLTDDWRLAAIKVYHTLGFRPCHAGPGHPDRWAAVYARLGIPVPRPRSD